MRISVIAEDLMIVVNGLAEKVPTETFDGLPNLRAFQWYGDDGFGSIEQKIGEQLHTVDGSLAQYFSDAYTAAKAAREAEEAEAAAMAAGEV